MEKANSLFVLEEYKKALKFYKKILADGDYSEEDRGIAKFCYGKCLFFLSDYEGAREMFCSPQPVPPHPNLTSKTEVYLTKIEHIKAAKSAKQVKKSPVVDDTKEEEVESSEPVASLSLPPTISNDMISEKKFRDKWWQSASTANFTIYAKGLKHEQVQVYFERTRLTVDVLVEAEGETYRRVCDLPRPILPKSSKWELTDYKVNVKLAKATPATWESFEPTKVKKVKKSSMESRNKKYEKLLHEQKDSDDEDGDDKMDDVGSGIQGLMKKLYNEGDDNMKRMIAETWTKSRTDPDYKSSFDK